MKVTVLTENTAARGLLCEHGLSLLIETGGQRILFDAGQSDAFAHNAESLGIDLSTADLMVLSHGHYDHSGGITTFLSLNDKAPVYLSRYAFEPHFNASGKDIGVDPGLRDHEMIIPVDGSRTLGEGISLRSAEEVPLQIDMGASGLTVLRGGERVPDDFRHEQYLLIEEGGKTVLFSGCAHKGIVNITAHFKPDVVFGGFHFMKMPLGDRLKDCAAALDGFPAVYYTCHCTGLEQYRFIEPYIRNLHYISAGDVIEL